MFSGGIAAGGCEPRPHGFSQPPSCSWLVSWVLFPCVSFTRQQRFEIHPRCGGTHSVFLLISVPWTDECFVLCSPVWELLGNLAKMKSGNRRVKSQERGTIGNCGIVFGFLWHRGASPRLVCDPWGGWQPPHGLRAEPPVSRVLQRWCSCPHLGCHRNLSRPSRAVTVRSQVSPGSCMSTPACCLRLLSQPECRFISVALGTLGSRLAPKAHSCTASTERPGRAQLGSSRLTPRPPTSGLPQPAPQPGPS